MILIAEKKLRHLEQKTWNTWFVIRLRSWRRTDAGRIATNPRSKSLFLIVENLLHHRLYSWIRWDPNLVKKSTTKEEHDKLWKTNNVIKVWRAHTFVGERRGHSPAVETTPSTPSLPIDNTDSPRTRSERQKRVRNNATEDLQHTDLLDGTNAQWENGGPDYFPCGDRPDPTRPGPTNVFFLNIWNFAQIRKLKWLKGNIL